MDLMQLHQAGLLNLAKAQADQAARDQAQMKMILAIPYLKNGLKPNVPVEEPAPDFMRDGAVTTDNVTTAPLDNPGLPLDKIMQAIGKFESGGNYNALGPVIKGGDRALGKYQIMESNLAPWAQAALGYPVSRSQFLGNPELQDKIAQYQMGKYYQKYGNPSDVASMWFSGRPSRSNAARDILGTSVPQYIAGVNRYL